MNIEQFSKEHLSAVLDAFIQIKGGKIEDKFFGICYNADRISTGVNGSFDAYAVVETFSLGWEKHSGKGMVPVPHRYNANDNKWKGTQGALRYELLDFLIDELTKVVEKCDD